MPVCCRCNGGGRCMSCHCVKSGRQCVDCLPSRKGHCCNSTPTPTSMPTTDSTHHLSLSTSTNTSTIVNSDASVSGDVSLSPVAGANASAILNDVTTATHRMDIDTARIRTLPSFKTTLSMTSTWGDLLGEEFMKEIDDAYAQVVHWRPNLFTVPSGACGKKFIAELTRFFNAFAMESDLESIALKAAMTLPSLVLQKPHAKSKTREHASCLQRRLSLWEKGDISNLLKEGRALQKSLVSSQPPKRGTSDESSTARKFSKMMMEGRVRAALKLLSDKSDTGLLGLNETVDENSGKTVRDVLEKNTRIQGQQIQRLY